MEEAEKRLHEKFHVLNTFLDHDDIVKFRKTYLDMHFYDQSTFYLGLKKEDRMKLYKILSPNEMGDMFDTIEDDLPEIPEFLAEMNVKYASQMLNYMYDDNAADVLEHLDKSEIDAFLNEMPKTDANNLRGLLHYDTETAGGIMTTDFVKFSQDLTCSEAIKELRRVAGDAETIYYLYILDDNKDLVGVMSLRDLILASASTKLSEVMNVDVVAVNVDDEQEKVAQVFRDYELLAVPVVDHSNKLVGIITVDDVIEVIDDEAQQDYSGLAGVDVDESINDNPFQAATKRLPWLITLLLLSMFTATLVNHYEGLLAEASILAVFISTITGTAGNAGTQSLAVAVRRLATEEIDRRDFFKLLGKELLTGLMTGIVTGVSIFVIVGLWKHNFVLGLVIGVAMCAAITVANVAGSFIPMLMSRLGFDPAVASGPFISTLSDLTSVLIYFSIAGMFLQYFVGK
ncbi:magnesium transporter [Companilactobacillus sp.]|jgi:magnesium transporter|uniref:magnesium transporter n=1 Tax=Companilactobacillus sp. TaxID=2767905 RepID=UPI0025BD0F71|nr:magnesium transporter [Companilactobacillus sp.]MCH4008830.1 magnesium transporter [Companilactobacillus sp.]MCH4050991.1 magnesium transporter [Companilactobacillus sp.]MCH4076773.1 magnesium transporter [Companilactobacillus sp.]MCH4125348.1 magnesium transporter [Companilactobacillus sp.]MCH4131889.1 magnesium transporter [Companilactobacillus sp.]